MTFETFKIIYLSGGILGVLSGFWLLRKERNDLLALSFISVLVTLIFISFYSQAAEYTPDTLLEEHILRVFTHLKKDLILTLGNAFLWCIVPFALGLLISKKYGHRFVWIFFIVVVLLKTYFDDHFLIHLYPEIFTHSVEWGDVLIAWFVVYFILALFITKGRKFLIDKPKGCKL